MELCKILIDAGADLLALNADGNMPYDVCDDDNTLDFIESEMAKRGITQEMIDDMRLQPEREMVEDLRRRFQQTGTVAELEKRDPKYGATPLHIAAANGYLEVAEFLLENGCATDCLDNDGWTPLHAAACWANADIVEILALHGADFDATNRYGETAQDVCDDPAIKQRITQLREEQRQARINGRSGRFGHSSNSQLTRHRGGSFRGSIVRRSSMREKNAIHKKDVEQERFQVLPVDGPDMDLGTSQLNGHDRSSGGNFLSVPAGSPDEDDSASPEGVTVTVKQNQQPTSNSYSNSGPRPASPTKSILVQRQSKPGTTGQLNGGGTHAINGEIHNDGSGRNAHDDDEMVSTSNRRRRGTKSLLCGQCTIL